MKKFLAFFAAALMVLTCAVVAFAATEPQVTNDTKAYVSFSTGNNDYSGLSAEEPKKQLLGIEDNGVVSILKDGGTMIAVGKLFIGGDYTLPELGSTLKITSADGSKNYKMAAPIENPSCAMKMQKNATLTLQSDVIIDDIILFQEHNKDNGPKFHVTNGATLVMGSKIETTTNINFPEGPYYAIEVDKGSAVILNGGTYQTVIGDGEVVNNGAKILEGAYSTESAQPAATAAVTEAPAATEAAPAATEEVVATVNETGAETPDETAPETTDAQEATEPAGTEAAPAETEAAAPETTAAAAETTGEKAGAPIGLIIGIIAAVVVVAAVVAVVIAKKKK